MKAEPRNTRPGDRRPDSGATSRDLVSPPPEYPTDGPEKLVVVRFGKMRHRGRFRCRTPGLVYHDKVVVQSERGIEIGEVTFDFGRGVDEDHEPLGWVIRRVTEEDLERHREFNEPLQPGPEFRFCLDRIAALDLPMRLVDVERPFGGGKIIFYFTADGRVDFRALVRDLAKRYRTRIEMKQIGVRDEAKVLGDVADCGQELCCRTFLTRLQPVSMRMAKVQKTTLDPAKISGRCGRLKCCLRYEFDGYMALRAGLPRPGGRVRYENRGGTVTGVDVLSQLVTVQLDEGERVVVHVGQIRREAPPAPQGEPDRAQSDRDTVRKGPGDPKTREPSTASRPPEESSPPAASEEAEPKPGTAAEEAGTETAAADSRPGTTQAPARGRRPGRKRGRSGAARRGGARDRKSDGASGDSSGPGSEAPAGDRPAQSSPPASETPGGKKGDESRRGRRRRRRGRPRKGSSPRDSGENGKPSNR